MKKKNQWQIKSIEGIRRVKAPRISKRLLTSKPLTEPISTKPSIGRLVSQAAKGGLTVLVSVVIIFTVVKAGSLTPSSAPASDGYTLENIYTRLTTNATSTSGGFSMDPSGSPAGTQYTLDQIYSAVPTIAANTVKLGTSYLGVDGILVPSGGDAVPADVLSTKIFFGGSQTDWNTQTGTMANNGAQAITPTTTNTAITQGYHDGAGYCAGDADLTVNNIKKSIDLFGVAGAYSGYPGTGWVANGSGNGSTALNQANCGTVAGWEWFEDGNGDGDTTDPEDGICVKSSTVTSLSWNGYDYTTNYDNTYIAAYTCSGNFPDGTVATYSGLDSAGAADTTWNDGDCALCQTDCYDGKKDLPDQGGYTSNAGGAGGYQGPITPEVLKEWKGTRLPTSNDFFGFCGATDADADSTAGDSLYHPSGASADVNIGNYGKNVGRGTSSEYMDLSNSSWEWLSEQHYSHHARVAGYLACSYFNNNNVYYGSRFRAVFRP